MELQKENNQEFALPEFNKNISKSLLIIKRECGHNQETMAGILEVGRSTYMKMEKGEYNFRMSDLLNICLKFKVNWQDVILGLI